MSIAQAKSSGHLLVGLPFGFRSARIWISEGIRNLGWRLEILPEGIRVRRNFQSRAIPWERIRGFECAPAKWGAGFETAVVTLAEGQSRTLGTFEAVFARTLRDRLRHEIAQRSAAPEKAPSAELASRVVIKRRPFWIRPRIKGRINPPEKKSA